jgi:hypothetical protein
MKRRDSAVLPSAAPQTAGFRVLLADRITSERRCPVNDVRARASRAFASDWMVSHSSVGHEP